MSSRRISAPNAISHKNTPLSALDSESPAERRAREKAEQQQERANLRTAGGRRVQTFMNRRQAVIDLRKNNPDEFRDKVRKCSAHTGNACPRSHSYCCTLTAPAWPLIPRCWTNGLSQETKPSTLPVIRADTHRNVNFSIKLHQSNCTIVFRND